MTVYNPPINDITPFLTQFTPAERLDAGLAEAILSEAAKLARDEIAPLNTLGETQPPHRHDDGTVTLPKAHIEAYAHYRDAGWNAVPFPEAYDGQALPASLAFAIQEFWQSASLGFGLCPLLNQSAIECLLAHGSDHQKQTYLPKLVSGQWTGTMNLTEPQAGSDLAAIRSKATPNDDVSYAVSGQKIYITYGAHDLADNIIHLVLARLPDAPEGVKGISLFIVPQFMLTEDGGVGVRNTVTCTGLEHKLGIHSSPTCTMQFEDATGYLVGEPHHGLMYMFTMMNNARLAVGLQGIGVGERAYQQAVDYADQRVQGKNLEGNDSIAGHPDVDRMLRRMGAALAGMRAITYFAAARLDMSEDNPNAKRDVDFLTPMVKGWCTDVAQEITSLNIQVHGGMGYIEETGAAQLARDARILPIYEGTNGIQANDLLFRKTLRDGGEGLKTFFKDLESGMPTPTGALLQSLKDMKHAFDTVLAVDDPIKQGHAAMPFMTVCAITTAGVLLSKISDESLAQRQQDFARYYLPQTQSLLSEIQQACA